MEPRIEQFLHNQLLHFRFLNSSYLGLPWWPISKFERGRKSKREENMGIRDQVVDFVIAMRHVVAL